VEILVARQPILDRNLKVYGYELLYRSCDRSQTADGGEATLQVITNSFLSIGADKLLGGAKGFVNCPQSILTDERIDLLPTSNTVLEVLENVKPEPTVIAACRRLKDRGFLLALDDFTGQPGYDALIELADIIKVEFPALTLSARAKIRETYGKRGIRMLAEKVETRSEFLQALDMGYDYYQGYFFARPVIVKSREIRGYKARYINILREIHKPEVDRACVANLVRMEASLTHRLLRYINSAAFAIRGQISSVRTAMDRLGDDGTRKWLWLAALPQLAVDKPGELMTAAAIRARFCESIAPLAGLNDRPSDLFLMGMFSFLDAMLDRPLQELLTELYLPKDIEEALLGAAAPGNRMAMVLDLVQAYEAADWETSARLADQLQFPEQALGSLYLQSVAWADEIFSSNIAENQPLAG